MDEPTAALAVKEVGKVLDLIIGLKNRGISVAIISHRMDDIFHVCDRVMALYHGTNFAEAKLAETTRSEVIGWVMGTKEKREGAGASPFQVIRSAPSRSSKTRTLCGSGSCRSSTVTAS